MQYAPQQFAGPRQPKIYADPTAPEDRWDWSPAAEHHKAAVAVNSAGNGGSGTFVEFDGERFILTAAHVIGGNTATITWWDGRKTQGAAVTDREYQGAFHDVAIVDASRDDVSPLQVSSEFRVGERVECVGFGGPRRGSIRHYWGTITGEDPQGLLTAANTYVIQGDSGGGWIRDGKELVGVQVSGTYPVEVLQEHADLMVLKSVNATHPTHIRGFLRRACELLRKWGRSGRRRRQRDESRGPRSDMYPPDTPRQRDDSRVVPVQPRDNTLQEDLAAIRKSLEDSKAEHQLQHDRLEGSIRELSDRKPAQGPTTGDLRSMVDELFSRQNEQIQQKLDRMTESQRKAKDDDPTPDKTLDQSGAGRTPRPDDSSVEPPSGGSSPEKPQLSDYIWQILGFGGSALGLGGLGTALWVLARARAVRRRRRRRRAEADESDGGSSSITFRRRRGVPLPRQDEEARQILRLSESEGRDPLHDAVVGRFAFDELENVIDSERTTEQEKDFARKLRRTLEDRFNTAAPLSA